MKRILYGDLDLEETKSEQRLGWLNCSFLLIYHLRFALVEICTYHRVSHDRSSLHQVTRK